MNRAVMLLASAILAALLAVSGIACEQTHYDMYLGTDAGAGFDAPAREVGIDAGADDTGGVDAGGVVDAGDQADAGDDAD